MPGRPGGGRDLRTVRFAAGCGNLVGRRRWTAEFAARFVAPAGWRVGDFTCDFGLARVTDLAGRAACFRKEVLDALVFFPADFTGLPRLRGVVVAWRTDRAADFDLPVRRSAPAFEGEETREDFIPLQYAARERSSHSGANSCLVQTAVCYPSPDAF